MPQHFYIKSEIPGNYTPQNLCMPIVKYQLGYGYAVQLHRAFTALSVDSRPDWQQLNASANFREDGKDLLSGPTGVRGMSTVRWMLCGWRLLDICLWASKTYTEEGTRITGWQILQAVCVQKPVWTSNYLSSTTAPCKAHSWGAFCFSQPSLWRHEHRLTLAPILHPQRLTVV